MHHVRAIGLIVWACMLLSFASARGARAADSLTYHVTMTPDAGNLPQYVCIVQQLAQHAVGILLTHPAGGGPAGAPPLAWDAKAAAFRGEFAAEYVKFLDTPFAPPRGATPGQRADVAAARQLDSGFWKSATQGALAELTAPKKGATCHRRDVCPPGVSLAQSKGPRYMICAANPPDANALDPNVKAAGVAVLELSWNKGFARVSGLRLNGSRLTMALDGARGESPLPQLSVVGGDYLPDPSASQEDGPQRFVVALKTRCHARTLDAPRAPAGSTWTYGVLMELPIDGAKEPARVACSQPDLQQIWIPRSLSQQAKRLTVDVRTTGTLVGKVQASWTEQVPPSAMRLEATMLSFTWKRPSFACNTRRCPRASVRGFEECTQPASGAECTYVCDRLTAAAPQGVSLPVEVSFQGHDVDRLRADGWTTKLHGPGAVLSDFYPREARRFPLRFTATKGDDSKPWPDAMRDSEAITELELVGHPVGRIPAKRDHLVYLPIDDCSRNLDVRLHGWRPFTELSRGEIRADGSLEIDAPTFGWQYSVAVGGGVFYLEPDRGARPMGVLSTMLTSRAAGEHLFAEWTLDLLVSSKPYVPLNAFGGTPEGDPSEAYARGLLGANVGYFRLFYGIPVGMFAGAALGGGGALTDTGAARVGAVNVAALIRAGVRIWPTSRFMLNVTVLRVLLEPRYSHSLVEPPGAVARGATWLPVMGLDAALGVPL
jgi:hypothetical protein